jgi:RimJ/RimL family protein N-acetyltransferase
MCPIIPTHQMLSIAPNLLTTQRLILRPWRETDREGFARLNDDPAVMEFMLRTLSRDESDALAAGIQAAIEKRGWGFWAVEVKAGEGAAAFIGFVGLSVPSFTAHFTSPIAKSRLRRFLPACERRDFRALPCVEIGWRLAKEHWGAGYASEAAAACLRFGFERLKLQQIVAFTVPLNKRSIGVMERIGMSRNPSDDFDHPKLPPGHPLQRHVLYRINRSDWSNRHG